MSVPVSESYARCAQIARHSSSNFYYSFFLLPRDQRRAINVLYAYLRKTDDLGDSAEPAPVRRQKLGRWRTSVETALAGRPSDDPIFPALVDVVCRYQIPSGYLLDVIDGVEMDLDPQGFETFDDLAEYCYRVASVVGLACIHIWGFRGGEAAVAAARKCGLAFQMTNILRDLKEDAAAGRIYLPREDLRRFDCTEDDLTRGLFTDRLQRLLEFEIERTEQLYGEAAELGAYLEPGGRRAWGAMAATYHRLLEEIRRRNGDVFTSRPRLGKWRRLQIAARWALPRPRLKKFGAEALRADSR